jgi:glutamine amidotransferase
MRVVLVDYGSGNLRSAAKALGRVSGEVAANAEIVVSGEPEDVLSADRVVLPGVGAYGDCRRGLDEKPGLVDALNTFAHECQRPFLGICVGMQLMVQRGLEHGVHPGLGWLPGEVAVLVPDDTTLKIPHMGWNELVDLAPHPLLAGIQSGDHAYFVHSYAVRDAAPGDVLARCDYGGPFTAMIGRDNIAGTQFHPEKSQETGLRLLANFLAWRP